ncbi:N-formylglutamate amidohydrolase [Paraburkholderia sp. BL6669N2]|uniref:N-formylglutamate amidohydrolase n=1 Tax=Paraburkholderia sp. BL6669N2 TaxID=1938807 RepID=UPI000E364F07|nr:N-formylglutamate amidohydrolase [Paraburkholderia sp. BL6669N2]REG58832.1 N-formylglutamate amidohydrolase [Paraburkholderia sp. BL6669N2]
MPNPGCDTLLRGDSPVLVVTPHTGTLIPQELRKHAGWVPVEGRLADPAGLLFHDAARRCGITLISARYHPCVIDFMVSADGPPLSVGVDRGGLCRTHTSRGESLYEPDMPLTTAEVNERVERIWRPFHLAVAEEIRRLRALHDHILLLVPHASCWLSPFREESAGRDCNVGTDNGKACDRKLVGALTESAKAQGRSWVVNGNIADGFTAEHYGNPASGIHVLNLEISGQWRVDCASEADRALAGPADGGALRASRDRNTSLVDTAMAPLLETFENVLRGLPAAVRTEADRHTGAHQL